ncbi:MarR family winged helix-turn-helix transcriptional regulator [Methanobacterium aggregans]|uniref:MarR family winged helix-turn-helix transcriptional regulator n=1 Tax=Methanobacterium aggregans TaxID=1615586 RepID=UPI001AE3D66E|nr:MarR family transcriptional regulator [Methanobacterium aggregans]MBP2045729.1 DNA-binding MarR family transcriptional regulator [Methanobacterium aggregans]
MKDPEELKAEFGLERLEMEKYILVVLFLVQQRWGYIINKEFAKDGITTKQWLMMVVMGNAFKHDPSMQEVAEAMSTTHQNVKQLATRLEARGFLKIERDKSNKRILRLKFTEESQRYWEGRNGEDVESVSALFQSLDDEEAKTLFEIMGKLERSSETLYKDSKNI